MTAGKSTSIAPRIRTPNRPESRASAAARAQRISALDGTQPTFRQSPPIKSRSIRATLAPTPAAPAAVTSPAVPAPIAVALGYDLLPKVDPALRMFDYDKASGGFLEKLIVNAAGRHVGP